MDEMVNSQKTEPPINASAPPPVKKMINPASWSFFIKFSIGAFAFFAAEIAYHYFVLTPRDFSVSLVRGAALAGATLIAASLFSSALFRWVPRWAQYWHIRRYLGVAGALSIIAHVAGVSYYYLGFNYASLFFTLNPIENPALFGVVGFGIILALLVTSTDGAMRILGRNWKRLHQFVYVAFAASILHFVFIRTGNLTSPPGYLLVAMTALAVFGQLFWFFRIISRKYFRSLGTVVGFSIIIVFVLLFWLGLDRRTKIEQKTQQIESTQNGNP